jgi:hypothetical protein
LLSDYARSADPLRRRRRRDSERWAMGGEQAARGVEQEKNGVPEETPKPNTGFSEALFGKWRGSVEKATWRWYSRGRHRCANL